MVRAENTVRPRGPPGQFPASDLHLVRHGALIGLMSLTRSGPMDIVLIAAGCLLMALGLMMAANRNGYVTFIVGPRSVVTLAAMTAVIAFWLLRASH